MFTNLCGAESPSKMPLWSNGAPGFEGRQHEPEKIKGSNAFNVHDPSITPYLSAKGDATGTAVIVARVR